MGFCCCGFSRIARPHIRNHPFWQRHCLWISRNPPVGFIETIFSVSKKLQLHGCFHLEAHICFPAPLHLFGFSTHNAREQSMMTCFSSKLFFWNPFRGKKETFYWTKYVFRLFVGFSFPKRGLDKTVFSNSFARAKTKEAAWLRNVIQPGAVTLVTDGSCRDLTFQRCFKLFDCFPCGKASLLWLHIFCLAKLAGKAACWPQPFCHRNGVFSCCISTCHEPP